MLSFFQALIYKTAALFTASLIAISGLLPGQEITIIPQTPTASRNEIVIEDKAATSTTASTSVVQSEKTSETSKNATSSLISSTTAKTEPRAVKAPSVDKKAPSIPLTPASALSAEQFLNRTKILLKQRLDGTYWPQFSTDMTGIALENGGTEFKWDPMSISIGGDSGMPKFNTSFTCNPAFDEVPPSIYSPVSFRIRTSYVCNLVFVNEMRQVSEKEFKFTTGPGFLLVSGASGLSSHLRQDINTNGISFTNNDDEPVTVTGLTFDVSLTAVNNENPAGIRFSDFNGNILARYLLDDVPKDPSKPFFNFRRGVQTSFPFKIEPHRGMVIFVEAINIPHLIVDQEPNVALVFNQISIDRSDIKIVPNTPITISWSCVAKYLPDDPDRMCH